MGHCARRALTLEFPPPPRTLTRFIGGAEQADDMTLLAVRRVAGTAT
jgi:hypothetical protein